MLGAGMRESLRAAEFFVTTPPETRTMELGWLGSGRARAKL